MMEIVQLMVEAAVNKASWRLNRIRIVSNFCAAKFGVCIIRLEYIKY